MVFFFSVTIPLETTLGISLSMNYMALVDLLGANFMGPELQLNTQLQKWAYVAVILGIDGMSVMEKMDCTKPIL